MNTTAKSMATTISMIALVLSLAVVSPTAALGKGNRRTGNPGRFQRENLNRRNTSASVTRFRSAASGIRSAGLMHGDFASFGTRRVNSDAFFKSVGGLSSETEVIAKPVPRSR